MNVEFEAKRAAADVARRDLWRTLQTSQREHLLGYMQFSGVYRLSTMGRLCEHGPPFRTRYKRVASCIRDLVGCAPTFQVGRGRLLKPGRLLCFLDTATGRFMHVFSRKRRAPALCVVTTPRRPVGAMFSYFEFAAIRRYARRVNRPQAFVLPFRLPSTACHVPTLRMRPWVVGETDAHLPCRP